MYRIGKEEALAVERTLESRQFFKINDAGREVQHFEEEWSKTVGSEYTLLMTSGYAAIESALVALGIGPGDEVIVPAYTYIATALAVTGAGAIPVIADIDETMTLSPESFEKNISEHTKAVIPVHIMGLPSNMDAICEIAKKHGIAVLEDACQSDGGMYHGRYLGSIGDAGAFSFNIFKVITSGEGGALVTNSRRVYERALIYHDASAVAFFGDQLSEVSEPLFGGAEYRVSDITGAIMREQLKRLPGILADLRRNCRAVYENVKTVKPIPYNDFDGACCTAAAFRFDSEKDCRAFKEKMEKQGIGITVPFDTGKHVYCNWTQIMERRGALHPAMDPFTMKENQGLNMNYTPDMCAQSLDLLSRTAYLDISPDWTDTDLRRITAAIDGE
jgi:dTDP-4-amino-4,6-dideoxygalactose transaminase